MLRFCILFLVLVTVSAHAELDTANQPYLTLYKEQEKALNAIAVELESLKVNLSENAAGPSLGEVEDRALEQTRMLNQRLDTLEGQLEALSGSLSSLKINGINDSLGMNFSVWTGILLASVSAIVTTLGVVIAIGSVFGYKKIMDSSRREAERVAKEEANQVAKEEVAERIGRGEFNALVIEAVDRVAFGNINSNNELDEEEGGAQ
ncbi:hypothetical protein [Grimontia hollisae]|uniref:hypothetical protein n=1 Tax=Grimontia hollisae TaxID=673 RepID=UPI00165E51A3|nr:hypothetical protein [Grimontia hollisae]